MRIGIISPYSLTLPGGVQGQILGLARELRSRGEHVRVLGPCDGPPPDAGVTPLGNSLPTAANGSMAPIAPDPAAQFRLLRALKDEDFDLLHLHEPYAVGPTVTAMVVKSVPLVGTFHAAGSISIYRLLGPLFRWGARRIDRKFAVSEDARAMAREVLGGDYELIFNGVEVPRFRDAEPWPTDGPTVFFIGRHEPRKGLEVLLEAMAHLPRDTRLWVAGEGQQTAELTSRTSGDPRIHWLGPITEQEKVRRMRGATVFCAPSLHGESFGIVLLEAMAARTPVVASSLPGYSNVARAGRDAELVAPGDPVALAKALTVVLSDPDRAHELVVSGIERADHFSMRRLADIYLECYRGLVHTDRGTTWR